MAFIYVVVQQAVIGENPYTVVLFPEESDTTRIALNAYITEKANSIRQSIFVREGIRETRLLATAFIPGNIYAADIIRWLEETYPAEIMTIIDRRINDLIIAGSMQEYPIFDIPHFERLLNRQ
jgi:hypothetical protein